MCSSEKMTTKTKMLSTDSDSSTRYAAKYSVAALRPWVAASASGLNLCLFSKSFADRQVGVIENERRTPRQEGTLRHAPDNPPQSRKDESVYRHEVITVVCGDAAKHISGVVEASQHEVVAEVELLHLRVRRHVVRVGHLEDAPGFAAFDVRLELTRDEARPSKEEGRRQIVPARVAEKVGQVEAIPGCFAHMPRKGRAWIGTLFDDRAVTAFDPHPIRGEDPAIVGLIAQPLKDGPRCRSVYRSRRPVMTRIALDIQQPTGEVERQIDRANGAPAVEATVCCDDGTK